MSAASERAALGIAGTMPGRRAATPCLPDTLIGIAAQSMDRMLGAAMQEHDKLLEASAAATRRAWLDDPTLMLRELHANSLFVAANPGANLHTSAERWQLYADVMTAIMGRRHAA